MVVWRSSWPRFKAQSLCFDSKLLFFFRKSFYITQRADKQHLFLKIVKIQISFLTESIMMSPPYNDL